MDGALQARNPVKRPRLRGINIGALIIRIGFWGILYYNYNEGPPEIVLVAISAPIP